MAFFEALGGKIINAGQSIAQSTKNFADVTKLNSTVSDLEKQIMDMYTIIGKAYYEQHKNDANAEERQRIMAVNALFQQIDGIKRQIKEIEGLTKCPNCGADVPRDALFCNNCGSKIVKESTGRRCTNCGMPLVTDSVFCAHCGTKVEQEEIKAENVGAAGDNQKHCPICNAILSDEDAFCSGCGNPVKQALKTEEVADVAQESGNEEV